METQRRIASQTELRERYGDPLQIAVAIEEPYLDEHHKNFIANSPFVCLASSGEDGQPTISPKGDTPGFVSVIDDHTLVIPDRPGNNKVMSFQNILANPRIALIFFVTGVRETLRIEGEADLVLDEQVLELGRAGDRLPRAAVRVTVTKAYMHCGKALIRSKLRAEDSKAAAGAIPSFGEIVKDQANAPMSVEEVQSLIDHDYQADLY